MSFLSGLFSDKKTVDTTANQQSSQQGSSQTGLSNQVKDYWSSISGLYDPSSWTNVDPNAYQTDAANRTAGYASGLNPAFGQANQIGSTGISGSDISRFMSPYTQTVVDATRANFAQDNARSDAQTNANAAKLGALSGTQPLVARAITESMRRPGQDATIAGLYDKGFQTSLNAANQSTGLQLQGLNSANAIAGQQSGINQTGFGQGTQLWNQDWQNSGGQAAQAAQGAQVLASLSPASGVTTSGSATGSSTGTNTTTATPSPFSIGANLVGMGVTAGWKPFADGGRVEMATGGSVGVKPREPDPHHRLTTAFDAVRGMLERARGGSVLPKFDAGGSVGPSYSPSWNTTVTPAPAASSFDMKKFGEGLSEMGKPKDASGGDDGAGALRSAQQDLSSFMSRNSIRPGYAEGGEVDEYGGGDGDLPAPIAPNDTGGRSVLPPGPVKSVMSGYAPEGAKVPRSVRTNNPGAMNYGPFAKANGAIGSDGRLAIFPDADTGYGAMSKLLDVYGRRGQNTVASIIGGLPERPNLAWAPRGVDNNSTDQYITKIAKNLGIDPNAPLPPERRQELMREMAAYEAGGTPAAPGSASGVAPAPAVASWGTPSAAAAAAPAEKTWMQRNLPGLTEGVFDGQKMTPGQRLGTALMSVRGPMFEGPANGIARSIMEMDGSRMKDDQLANQKAIEDRRLGLAEAKSPAEIALLNAQAAAQKAAQENGRFVQYDPEKGVMNARTGEIKPPSQTGVNTQKIADEAYAKDSPKLLTTSVESADNARSMIGNIREMKALSDNMYSGALVDQRLAAAKIGRLLGLDFDPLKIANSEQFQAKMQEFVLTAAQKLKPLSNSDITFVEKGMPGLARDPSTIGPMLDSMERIAQRNILIEKYRQEFYSRGKRPDNQAIEARVDKEIPPPNLKPPPPGSSTGAGSSAGLSPAPSSTASGNALPEGTIINGPAGRLVLKGGKWEPYSSAADERARDLARSREVGASARGGAFGTPTDGY